MVKAKSACFAGLSCKLVRQSATRAQQAMEALKQVDDFSTFEVNKLKPLTVNHNPYPARSLSMYSYSLIRMR